MSLLRQYEPFECGEDGYPYAWHHPTRNGAWLGSAPLDSDPAIKDLIREQAQHRCERCWHPYTKGMGEWSPCDEACKHGGPVQTRIDAMPASERHKTLAAWVEAQWRVLTVHHLTGVKSDCRWWNLVALCQRDHLYIQRVVKMDHVFPYEHSTWFKPYAAGYYAWKYLAEDLTREETMARQDELLALEHRFTQGTLL